MPRSLALWACGLDGNGVEAPSSMADSARSGSLSRSVPGVKTLSQARTLRLLLAETVEPRVLRLLSELGQGLHAEAATLLSSASLSLGCKLKAWTARERISTPSLREGGGQVIRLEGLHSGSAKVRH